MRSELFLATIGRAERVIEKQKSLQPNGKSGGESLWAVQQLDF
jgi:hypothetical protein